MKRSQTGFTLMEMIGVVAVIAILASMATPMIFEAIRNSRISAQAQDINVLKTAVARYYQDTGQFPVHNPSNSADGAQLLMSNSTSSPVTGWDGPYIDKQLVNRIGTGGISLLSSDGSGAQFDLDGDGTDDTDGVVVLWLGSVGDSEIAKINQIIDNDADGTGDGAPELAGRVRVGRTNSDAVLVYITRW